MEVIKAQRRLYSWSSLTLPVELHIPKTVPNPKSVQTPRSHLVSYDLSIIFSIRTKWIWKLFWNPKTCHICSSSRSTFIWFTYSNKLIFCVFLKLTAHAEPNWNSEVLFLMQLKFPSVCTFICSCVLVYQLEVDFQFQCCRTQVPRSVILAARQITYFCSCTHSNTLLFLLQHHTQGLVRQTLHIKWLTMCLIINTRELS